MSLLPKCFHKSYGIPDLHSSLSYGQWKQRELVKGMWLQHREVLEVLAESTHFHYSRGMILSGPFLEVISVNSRNILAAFLASDFRLEGIGLFTVKHKRNKKLYLWSVQDGSYKKCNLYEKSDFLQIKSKANKPRNSEYNKWSSASDLHFVSDGCNRRCHLGRAHKPGSFPQSVPLVLPRIHNGNSKDVGDTYSVVPVTVYLRACCTWICVIPVQTCQYPLPPKLLQQQFITCYLNAWCILN